MTGFYSKVSFGLVFLGLAACGSPSAPTPSQAARSAAPHDTLRRIVDRYWEEHLAFGNPISPQSMADSLAAERRFLGELLAVPRAGLDAEAGLTYDIFKEQRELDIEGFTYPTELLPINPFDGIPLQFARAAAEVAQIPFKNAQDYENWQHRIDDNVRWERQAIANMRDGMRRGYTSPRVLVERMLPILQNLDEDRAANVFYIPLRNMPAGIGEPARTRISTGLSNAVRDKLLPAYRELHDFILGEYLPRTRATLALSELPMGASWYAYRVKRATGTQMTPGEIHGIGVAEVERIRARLLALPPAAPPAGTTDLVGGYQELKAQTLAAMPTLFSAVAQADFEIRSAGPPGDSTSVLVYRRAGADSGAPAVLFVNTAAIEGQPVTLQVAGFLQEALPGRHYQSALQQGRTDLPKFRRYGDAPAFVDGWALYAASLGEELGLYREADATRDALLGQLRCATALVVDTGLHAQNWTRAQAAAYLGEQLSIDAAAAGLMIERFAAFPGAALACKMGELKFQALRVRAQQVMGARFDIHEFHSEILEDGAMPLDILDAKLKRWMEARH